MTIVGRTQPVAMLALAVVAGLPHGASDFAAGRTAFRSFGASWWYPFLVGYLALVGVTLTAWAVVPAPTLIFFLLLSMIHFGRQDAAATRPSWIATLAHGGVPIIVPALFHSREVADLFAVLVGSSAMDIVGALAGPAAVIWSAMVALLIWRVACSNRGWPQLADLLVISALFAAAAPLVAFALYFALLHTPRAWLAERQRADSQAEPAVTIALSGLAVLLGIGIFLAGDGLTVDAGIVRTSFLLLSALTVPHMALEALRPDAA